MTRPQDATKRARKHRIMIARDKPSQVGPVKITIRTKRGKAGRFIVIVEEIERTQIDARL